MSFRFSIAPSKTPNEGSWGQHRRILLLSLAVEELALTSCVALGPGNRPDPRCAQQAAFPQGKAPRPSGPASASPQWLRTWCGAGGNIFLEEKQAQNCPKNWGQTTGPPNDQTCLLEQPSERAISPEEQCSSCPSVPLLCCLPGHPFCLLHLAKSCLVSLTGNSAPGSLLGPSPGVPPGSHQSSWAQPRRQMGWGLGAVMSFLSPLPGSPLTPPSQRLGPGRTAKLATCACGVKYTQYKI